MRRDILICFLLLATTVSVYWTVGSHEFTNYDDPLYVTENPRVQAGLSRAGVAWAFGKMTSEEGNYWHPITWLSHMADCQFFGVKAGPQHLMNLAFHAANVLLLYLMLRRMTGLELRSAAVAGLFALHPLQVDTVAWVAERKNVLSTFFWLLAILAYIRYARRPGVGRYIPVVILFALGLMSKPMLVTFPCVLLLLDFWPLRRIRLNGEIPENAESGQQKFPSTTLFRLIFEKLPLFALAGISGVITIIGHQRLGLLTTTEQLSLPARLVLSTVSYLAYLSKAIWPTDLAVFYPLPKAWPLREVIWAAVVLGGITLAAGKLMRQKPFVLVGWLWFLGTLTPVIGILQVSQQAMADRWAYVPLIGLLIMVVWGLADLLTGRRFAKAILLISTLVVMVILGGMTRKQLDYWQNSETLFRHALAVTTNNYVAHLNLGNVLSRERKFPEAIGHFEAVLKIQPHSALGHMNLGSTYALSGKPEEAIAEFKLALQANPKYPRAQCNWGNVLALQKKYDEAKLHYQAAIGIDTNCGEAYGDLGNVYFLEGDMAQAEALFEKAIGLDPALVESHYLLAGILARQKKFDEAIVQYRAVLKYKPNDVSALNDLAWILATEENTKYHDPIQAVRLAQTACELTVHEDAGYLDTLGAAYSEAGRFSEAVEAVRKATGVARKNGQLELAEKIDQQVAFYQKNISYRVMVKSQKASLEKP